MRPALPDIYPRLQSASPHLCPVRTHVLATWTVVMETQGHGGQQSCASSSTRPHQDGAHGLLIVSPNLGAYQAPSARNELAAALAGSSTARRNCRSGNGISRRAVVLGARVGRGFSDRLH